MQMTQSFYGILNAFKYFHLYLKHTHVLAIIKTSDLNYILKNPMQAINILVSWQLLAYLYSLPELYAQIIKLCGASVIINVCGVNSTHIHLF